MIHEMDGIEISDLCYDKVCLNCVYWVYNSVNKVVCSQGQGATDPDDYCPMFYHQNSRDDDLDAAILKDEKLRYYYMHR